MTTTITRSTPPMIATLRRLYFVRFGFAVAWAVLLIATSPDDGALLTVLLVSYPLFDAAAVLWQRRSDDGPASPRRAESINIGVSLIVAVAIGWASTISVTAALAVWGVWAAAAGITQLVTAAQRRQSGGQVPQIVSGAISVVAGLAFLAQSFQDTAGVAGVGGYAILGGIFFLTSAVRLSRPTHTS